MLPPYREYFIFCIFFIFISVATIFASALDRDSAKVSKAGILCENSGGIYHATGNFYTHLYRVINSKMTYVCAYG